MYKKKDITLSSSASDRTSDTLSALALCLALALGGCSQSDAPEAVTDESVALNVVSAELQGSVSVETRANARANIENGAIGVFRSQGAGYDAAQNNMKYSKGTDAGSTWGPDGANQTIYLTALPAEVCAYYPHNSDAAYSDPTQFLLTAGKYTGSEDLSSGIPTTLDGDICYAANQTKNGADRNITFVMKHSLAVLHLSFQKSYNTDIEHKISEIALRNSQIRSKTHLNITNGSITPLTDVDGKVTDMGEVTIHKRANEWDGRDDLEIKNPTGSEITMPVLHVYALLIPGALQGSTKLYVKMQGMWLSLNLTGKLTAIEQGKIYNLPIVVQQSGIAIESDIKVEDWVTHQWGSGVQPDVNIDLDPETPATTTP
ncbi:MAG: fimbrillin family protein [Bacteroides sp.]|nr:fimbrillin family protein [Bacteroides sp.]